MTDIFDLLSFLSRKVLYQWAFIKLFPTKAGVYNEILLRYSEYYRNLSEENKKEFIKRVAYFINDIEFKAAGRFNITDEMKVLVSCAFVTITFGLSKHGLKHFFEIYITEKPYRYPYSRETYIGDVNATHGTISLVWPIVESGFLISNDSKNLAIHEIAHAFIIDEHFNYSSDGRLVLPMWKKWKEESVAIIESIKSNPNHLVRPYATVNYNELFSVSLEYFFEQPEKLKRAEPKLFKLLQWFLRQNPINKDNPTI